MSQTSKSPQLPIIDHQPTPYQGPSREEVLALRHQYVSPGVITYYREPLMLVEGHMQYLWDDQGQRYLDAFAGIVTVSVGHCHPEVIKKVREQTGRLQHTTTIYLHPNIVQFAEKLASKMPAGLNRSYFTNSGSEANEVAILSAREFTGHQDVIAQRNGYHGGTSTSMSITAHGTWKFPSNTRSHVHHTHAGYCYRCPYGLEYPSCDLKCAHDIKNVIEYQTPGEIACFIGEPIQGVGGAVVPPKEFFPIVYDIVRQHGGLCIADEVQGGFGRTGHHYWSYQNWGVVPDMVTMAKGIGNGAPVGAVIAKDEIAEAMKGKLHFNTFGGDPYQAMQASEVVDIVLNDNLIENSKVMGNYLKEAFKDLQKDFPVIGDVRGRGLMLGLELVKDRKTKEPAANEAALLMELSKGEGLLIGKGGLYGNVIRIAPSLGISKSEADELVTKLRASFQKLS